ncbi:MAG TPA: hypothetical protein VKR53_05395 [Puia sp.]|nr:hypothetical protein [Puia sp.]
MLRRLLQSIFPKNNLDALIPATVGFLIIFIYTRHSGVGVSPDSVTYLSVARNIHSHGILVDFDNRPLVIFPVLYSVFLSLGMWVTGTDPLSFGAVINCILFFKIIYLTGWLLEKLPYRSKWYKHIILSCIVLSPCLLEVYSMLWSETLFIFLLLLFFIALRKYFQTLSIRSLMVAALVGALSCIARYAGVSLIGAGCLLLFFDPRLPPKKKILHIGLFASASASLLIINLVRNSIVSATLTGMREKSITSLNDNIFFVGNVLCEWLPVPTDNYFLSYCVAMTAIFGCAFTLFYYIIKRNDFSSVENIFAAYFITYALFIILSATVTRYEQITSRLFSASFIPFICGSGYWVLTFIKKIKGLKKILLISVSVVAIIFFQRNQLVADDENYDGIKDAGVPGYTEDPWYKDSEVANFIRKNYNMFQPGYELYSNGDDGVYFFSGLPCNTLPHRVNPKEIQLFYKKKYCYVIWMDDADNPELIDLKEILANKKMKLLRQFSNGAIYITNEIPENAKPW